MLYLCRLGVLTFVAIISVTTRSIFVGAFIYPLSNLNALNGLMKSICCPFSGKYCAPVMHPEGLFQADFRCLLEGTSCYGGTSLSLGLLHRWESLVLSH
jgi:hypothetical protein